MGIFGVVKSPAPAVLLWLLGVAGCGAADETASYHVAVTITAVAAPSNTTFIKHAGKTYTWLAGPGGSFSVKLQFSAKDQASWRTRAAASMGDPLDQIRVVRDGAEVAHMFLPDPGCEATTIDGAILGNEASVILTGDTLGPSCFTCKYELADHVTCI